ncbi:MAG TPA: hypothetical protein PLR37_03695 [Candidatus Accumulibacter phosphatis]|nr:hypothetical protein [Candidatus Accumulibacter phosphatis]
MKTIVLALLVTVATAGCVVAPAQPGYYGPPRAYLNPPVVVVEPPRVYGYPPPVVVPWRPYYGHGYWHRRYRGDY